MKPHHIVQGVRLNDGSKVTVEVYTRGGWQSPTLEIFLYKGRRVTPFEARVRGLPGPTLEGLFALTYWDFGKLVNSWTKSPIFDRIPKKEPDSYLIPIRLSPEGFVFGK